MMLANAAFGVIAVMLVDPFAKDVHLIDVPRDDARELLITTAACLLGWSRGRKSLPRLWPRHRNHRADTRQ
jgi:hypothetical protein